MKSTPTPAWDLSGDNNGHETEDPIAAAGRRRTAVQDSGESDFDTGVAAGSRTIDRDTTPTPAPAQVASPTVQAEPEPATPEQPGMFTAAQVMRDRTEQRGNNPDLPPAEPHQGRCPLLAKVLKSRTVKDPLDTAKAAQKRYSDTLTKVDHLLDPQRRYKQLVEQIDAATDPDEIQKLRDEAVLCQSAAGFASQQSAKRIAMAEYQRLHSTLVALFDAAEKELKKLGGEIEVAEGVLFKGYGLKREATPLTRRLNENLRRIALHRDAVALNVSRERANSHVPPHQGDVLATFAE